MKHFLQLFILTTVVVGLLSCGDFMQGMGQGMGGYRGYGYGYGMGYQMFPGYVPPPAPPSAQQILNMAAQQVEQQNQQEYQVAKRYRPNLTYQQFLSEKAKAYETMRNSGSSTSSSGSSSSSSGTSRTSSKDCHRCLGTGKCQTCNGRGYYDTIGVGSGRHACPNCASNHNGKCASCNGTGKG